MKNRYGVKDRVGRGRSWVGGSSRYVVVVDGERREDGYKDGIGGGTGSVVAVAVVGVSGSGSGSGDGAWKGAKRGSVMQGCVAWTEYGMWVEKTNGQPT